MPSALAALLLQNQGLQDLCLDHLPCIDQPALLACAARGLRVLSCAGAAELAAVPLFDSIQRLDFSRSAIDDAAMRRISVLEHLTDLNISG